MPGLNGKKIKRSTVSMYNADGKEVFIQSSADYVIIREEYTDGTFTEVWGSIEEDVTG